MGIAQGIAPMVLEESLSIHLAPKERAKKQPTSSGAEEAA